MLPRHSHVIRRGLPWLQALGIVGVVCAASSVAAAERPVKVEGGQVSASPDGKGVRVYKGIPYAAPPVGELRWKAPQPVKAWVGVRDGSKPGAACPQALRNPATEARLALPPLEAQSEDCLFLNVWTPAARRGRLPVMVWIHGGGLNHGSGVQYTPNAGPLAEQGVVVVTINYRLGALGFLAHPELTAESARHVSGNYGLLDQIAALQWVQRNIAAFGGDPKRVTVFGYSAGGWSIATLMASPLAKGLFQRAIAESGGRFGGQRTLKDGEAAGLVFARHVGAASLKELRGLPAEKLLLTPVYSAAPSKEPGFLAEEVVDGWLLPREARAVFADGQQHHVPVIAGANGDEGIGAARESRSWARALATTGRVQAFQYYFTHKPPHPMREKVGAYHGGELPYVFNDLEQHAWPFTPVDRMLAGAMSRYWVNFAKTGNPNGAGLPTWEPFDLTSERYLNFGETIEQGDHLLKDKLDASAPHQSTAQGDK